MFILNIDKDIIYFSSKRETDASILAMSNPGPQIPYRVTLKYFNDYVGKEVTCSINVKKSYGNKIKEKNSKIVQINYGKGPTQDVYLADYETPNIGLILFDILAIAIMLTAVVVFFRAFTCLPA